MMFIQYAYSFALPKLDSPEHHVGSSLYSTHILLPSLELNSFVLDRLGVDSKRNYVY
jgi:hypothetical protein